MFSILKASRAPGIALAVMALAATSVAASTSSTTAPGRVKVFPGVLEQRPGNPTVIGNQHGYGQFAVVVTTNTVTVTESLTGLAPNLPHAQHIHGQALHTCPRLNSDTNHDGYINTAEGMPSYGPILVSLTTTGDATPASALAVTRFPVADANGNLEYNRTLVIGTDITRSVADGLRRDQIVSHGMDTNMNHMYDFSLGASELDPTLPQEATVPAVCGVLRPVTTP